MHDRARRQAGGVAKYKNSLDCAWKVLGRQARPTAADTAVLNCP